MNVVEFIKNKVMKYLGLSKISDPNSKRLTYINDEEAIRLSNIEANFIWYLGDGDSLLDWYTSQQTYGWAENPIHNRNKRLFFWGMSINEAVKRIHSGVPKAIVDTLSNIVGMPNITSSDNRLPDIFEENNFEFMLMQQVRPLTLAVGDGAIKINLNPTLCNHPLMEWYDSKNWGPIVKSNITLGMWFKSYYKDKDNKDYVLYETRTLRPEGLAIEYQLFQLDKSNNLISCDIHKIPELQDLQNQLIQGCHCLLAVANKYYYDPLHPNRGKSIYDGKLDSFDFMDEILTQAGQTNRVSTPVEYYPVDLLERSKAGTPVLPKLYNRQYVKIDATPDGDGNVNNEIKTTQPDLNFDRYMQLYYEVLGSALIGICSPSTLGIDVAKKDNADAQREKEKQTTFTTHTIKANETKMLVKLCNMLLMCQDYLETGIMQEKDYQISVKYNEFGNPVFESELQILGPAWNNGQISTERYAQILWAGKLSDEELAQEIQWLDDNKKNDDFDMNALMEHENEINNRNNLSDERPEKEAPVIPQK